MKKEKSTVAQAAQMIRKILKESFPSVKFSVQSERYAGGDSINIAWYNTLTTADVKQKVAHFQYGYFDSMTDCYEYSNAIDGLPQTMFLSYNNKLAYENLTSQNKIELLNFKTK